MVEGPSCIPRSCTKCLFVLVAIFEKVGEMCGVSGLGSSVAVSKLPLEAGGDKFGAEELRVGGLEGRSE